MKFRFLAAAAPILAFTVSLAAQVVGDTLGVHNLGPGGGSPVQGARPDSCAYCHAAHSGLDSGLWNQKLTVQQYDKYQSTTAKNIAVQPALGGSSNQCLSCHDGTVAVGTTVVYGSVTTHGTMNAQDVFGASMQTSHPFSLALPLKDAIHLVATLVAAGKTADPTHAVRLHQGNVECTSCHDPHVQSKDQMARNFLVKDSSSGQLCLACHDPARTIGGQVNPLADWTDSVHALSDAKITPGSGLGSYPTVGTNACSSCHASHNASGASELLRGLNEQACIGCHNGSNVSPMPDYANVFAEYASPRVGHPFPDSKNPHDPAEDVLLKNNRHATCADCHQSHGTQKVGIFPEAPLLRISQKNITGVSATDGISVLTPAINQYENCLRCHGSGSGKKVLPIYGYFAAREVSAGDDLDLRPQFAAAATSSHPVTHTRSSSLPQPSLLSNMLKLDGVTAGRAMGAQILCTDCHNSDDNREFGGTGANGPHGSKWTHILERRYEFSQAVTPGGTVTNLFPNPDVTNAGPYALCGKCHDLPNQILKDTSWTKHSQHINAGLSCSTCHTAHGLGAASGDVSGERLVNFDVNVVGPNGSNVSYNRATNTCTLSCHGKAHNSDGSVTSAAVGAGFRRVH